MVGVILLSRLKREGTTQTLSSGESETRMYIKSSFVNGMSEFLEGKVSLICRKIILIHGQGPGFGYLEDKRFK